MKLAKIVFNGSDIQKVAKASKKFMRLVHDDGTYIIPDVAVKPLIRPVSGDLPAGEGDDFVEKISVTNILKSLKPKVQAWLVTLTKTRMTVETYVGEHPKRNGD